MNKRKTTSEFICESNKIHNNKYDYSNVIYKNAFTKVKIICKQHGEFLQSPHDHVRPRGCPSCANEIRRIKTKNSKQLNLAYFISAAKLVHQNRYGYEKSEYKGMLHKIVIICNIHGEFSQAAHSHLAGNGCRKCGLGNHSKKEKAWLDSYNIPEEFRQHMIHFNNEKIFVDGFDPNTKTVYEFYGDFWHGNPAKFNSSDQNALINKSFGELYYATMVREQKIKEAGYNLVSIWENDYNKIKGYNKNKHSN